MTQKSRYKALYSSFTTFFSRFFSFRANDTYRFFGGIIVGGIAVILAFYMIFTATTAHTSQEEKGEEHSLDAIAIVSSENNEQTGEHQGYFTPKQIRVLENLYDTKPDDNKELAAILLHQYSMQGNIDKAFGYRQKIEKNGHASLVSGENVAMVIYNMHIAHNQIHEPLSSWEQEGGNGELYKGLYLLGAKDYTAFHQFLESLPRTTFSDAQKNSPAGKVYTAFYQAQDTYKNLKDAPSYYYTGLLAAASMQAGYIALAEVLADDIRLTDDSYTLVYEILSQVALKKQDYTKAKTLLHKLLTIDTQHASRTSFFLGMTYYHLGDYGMALSYLNQVNDTHYLYDALKYMVLAYHQQGDDKRMMDGYRYLLSQNALYANDYALFFDIIFYDPYITQGSGYTYPLVKEYSLGLIVPMIDSCRKKIQPIAPAVCKYGEAGWYISQKKPEKALKNLLYSTKMYPHPAVFQALGDYYTSIQDTAKAESYYMKAMMSRADSTSP